MWMPRPGGGGSGASGTTYSGGGGGGYSGGAGGGTPNSNTTVGCESSVVSPFESSCYEPGTPVPSAGGTSFASGVVQSPVVQLAITQAAGFVQVVRLG